MISSKIIFVVIALTFGITAFSTSIPKAYAAASSSDAKGMQCMNGMKGMMGENMKGMKGMMGENMKGMMEDMKGMMEDMKGMMEDMKTKS